MKKSTSPTFLLELPLQVNSHQAKHLQGHFEAARNLYNALLGEALQRLNKMRADSRYAVARTLAKGPERSALFTLLRKEYDFSTKFPPNGPNSHNFVMDVRRTARSPYHNGGITVLVVLDLYNVTCTVRALHPTLICKPSFPLLTLKVGSVWRRACRQQ